MPKVKTHRGAAKRIKKTGTGKYMKMKGNKSHILTKKTTKRKRKLRKANEVNKGNARKIKQVAPYL